MNQSIKTTVNTFEIAKEMIKNKIFREIKAKLVPPPGVRGQTVLNGFNSFSDNPDRAIIFTQK